MIAPASVRAAFSLLLATGLAACDSVGSSEVATAEMGVVVWIEADDSARATATVQLTTDNPALLEQTFIDLEVGDALYLSSADRRTRMTEEFVVGFGIYQYTASQGGMVGGEAFAIELRRAAGDDAPATTAILPQPIRFAPRAATFPRGAGLELAWSGGAGSDRVTVTLSGSCLEQLKRELPPETTSLSIAADELSFAADGAAEPCPIQVALRAVADGVADPAFGRGGQVQAVQVDSLELTATP